MNAFSKTVVSICLICFVSINLFAQTSISRLSDDLYEVQLNNQNEKEIRILQVTDLHLGKVGFWKQDLTSFKRIKRLVEQYNPHLIAITGDLLTGEKPFGSLLAAFAVQFFDSLKRPWLFVFGNHDPEGGFGRDQIYEVFQESDWGILGFHPVKGDLKKKYDYAVEVKPNPESITQWIIYGFDSGSHKGFKSIKTDQLLWYKNISQKINPNKKARAISIFHIPLQQYQDLWKNESIQKFGESKEKVYFEEDEGTVYDFFVQMGEIEATFCGHDHYNNYWGKYPGGIILAYGYISGEATKWAWPTGGKLITLPFDDSEIRILNVVPEL
jgi:predicted MPP superfamily phosphohydrolase